MNEFGFWRYTGVDLHEEADGLNASRALVNGGCLIALYIGDLLLTWHGQKLLDGHPYSAHSSDYRSCQ